MFVPVVVDKSWELVERVTLILLLVYFFRYVGYATRWQQQLLLFCAFVLSTCNSNPMADVKNIKSRPMSEQGVGPSAKLVTDPFYPFVVTYHRELGEGVSSSHSSFHGSFSFSQSKALNIRKESWNGENASSPTDLRISTSSLIRSLHT